MGWRLARYCLLALGCVSLAAVTARAEPNETIRAADEVLHEIMAIPARQIPGAC